MRNFNINNYIKMGFSNKSKLTTSIVTRYCDPSNPDRVREKLEELKVIDSIHKHRDIVTLYRVININIKTL